MNDLVVGICQFDIMLPGSQSLKDKRMFLRALKARLRQKFNLSIAEIGYYDKWQRSSLAMSVVGNQRSFVQTQLDRALEQVEDGEIQVLDQQVEIQ